MKVGRCGLQNACNWSPLFARVDDHRRKKCENWTYPFFLFVVLSLLDGSVCGGPLEWPNKLFHLTERSRQERVGLCERAVLSSTGQHAYVLAEDELRSVPQFCNQAVERLVICVGGL